MARIPIHSKQKGPLGQNEDWWTLVEDDKGSKFVEHEWSYTNAYGSGQDSGQRSIPVDEFLASDADTDAKAKLNAMLKT